MSSVIEPTVSYHTVGMTGTGIWCWVKFVGGRSSSGTVSCYMHRCYG